MKNKVVSIFVIIFIFYSFSGCLKQSNLNNKVVKDFRNKTFIEHNKLKSINFNYTLPYLTIIYISKIEMNNDEMFNIFYKTKEVINNEDFQKLFIEEYTNKYKTKENGKIYYPKVIINFDLNNDGKFDYQFESSYYRNIQNIEQIDGYRTWTYWDFKNDSKAVPD